MSKNITFTKKTEYEDRWKMLSSSALIAISLIILQSLISLKSPDTSQFIAIIAFAIAIPLLAGAVGIYQCELDYQRTIRLWTAITSLCLFIGEVAAITGIAAILWHLSWIASLLFLVLSLMMFLVYAIYTTQIERGMRDEDKGATTA